MSHLLVTNDFPPKIGGIQSYLWELWRRLPAADVTVLTTPYRSSAEFDGEQDFRVVRSREPVLLPYPWLAHRVRTLASQVGAGVVVLDPALPLGAIGPSLAMPYAVVLHGAEVTVPGRLPLTRPALARVLEGASLAIAAGGYPEAEARRVAGERMPPVVQVPPGVDTSRFTPLSPADKLAVRSRLGLSERGPLVLSVSRLVPRKGMDTLIHAASQVVGVHPDLNVAIAGSGRDGSRLEKMIARSGAPVRLLGRVPDSDLADLYACCDVFVLCCRSRWGGLEQEGFGIVFLEAAAAGVPSVAGDSGGAAEAVADGVTGTVIADPNDAGQLAAAIARLLDNPELAGTWGRAARRRVEDEFSYDGLAARLYSALEGLEKRWRGGGGGGEG